MDQSLQVLPNISPKIDEEFDQLCYTEKIRKGLVARKKAKRETKKARLAVQKWSSLGNNNPPGVV